MQHPEMERHKEGFFLLACVSLLFSISDCLDSLDISCFIFESDCWDSFCWDSFLFSNSDCWTYFVGTVSCFF